MIQKEKRSVLSEKKFNGRSADYVRLYTVCFISRRYKTNSIEGIVSAVDGMDLPEPRAWITDASQNEGVTINGIRYVFDVRAKNKMGELGFEFDLVRGRNLDIKRCIVEAVMEYGPSVRGSILKEDAERSV